MYFDLNIPAPTPLQVRQTAALGQTGGQGGSKKGKQKQQGNATSASGGAGKTLSSADLSFTPAQLAALESKLDMLVHCELKCC